MAYNNAFPMTYQQYYPQYPQVQQQMPVQQQTQQTAQIQQPMNNSIIWVQGEAGAKSYLIAPNTTVQLWDSEAQTIYLKSADASGMPSIKTLDYTIRDPGVPTQSLSLNENEFIRKDELNALKGQIQALEKEVNKLKPRRKEGEYRNGKSDL